MAGRRLLVIIDGFHGTFYHGNWRALHHHLACWLVNIHITWPFASSFYNYGQRCYGICLYGSDHSIEWDAIDWLNITDLIWPHNYHDMTAYSSDYVLVTWCDFIVMSWLYVMQSVTWFGWFDCIANETIYIYIYIANRISLAKWFDGIVIWLQWSDYSNLTIVIWLQWSDYSDLTAVIWQQ